MSLPSSLAVVIAAVAAGFTLVLAGSAEGQVVVLFARGPSASAFPTGKVLPANQVLSLKAGDTLELLDGSGSHVLTGPLVVTAGHVEPKVRDQLIQTFLKAQQSRPGIAASRGMVLQPSGPPDLWQVDVAEAGDICVPEGRTPALWRGEIGAPRAVGITRVATGETLALVWPADASSIDWPAAFKGVDQDRFVITLDDGSVTPLIWRALEANPAGLDALAADLLDRGCYSQLDRVREAFAMD